MITTKQLLNSLVEAYDKKQDAELKVYMKLLKDFLATQDGPGDIGINPTYQNAPPGRPPKNENRVVTMRMGTVDDDGVTDETGVSWS